jgi:hypothetical protein
MQKEHGTKGTEWNREGSLGNSLHLHIFVSPKKQLWTSVSHIRTEQKVARRLLFLGFYHQLGFLIRVHPPPHTASPGGILRNAGRSPVSDPWF